MATDKKVRRFRPGRVQLGTNRRTKKGKKRDTRLRYLIREGSA